MGDITSAMSLPFCFFSGFLSQCLRLYAPSVPWSRVDSCVKGDLGYQLMRANALMTRALNPAHTHVPWITFNGVKCELRFI